MENRVGQLLEDALGLPQAERSALVVALLDSLESTSDHAVADAWRVEVRRRREELRTGAVAGMPWEEAKSLLRSL